MRDRSGRACTSALLLLLLSLYTNHACTALIECWERSLQEQSCSRGGHLQGLIQADGAAEVAADAVHVAAVQLRTSGQNRVPLVLQQRQRHVDMQMRRECVGP